MTQDQPNFEFSQSLQDSPQNNKQVTNLNNFSTASELQLTPVQQDQNNPHPVQTEENGIPDPQPFNLQEEDLPAQAQVPVPAQAQVPAPDQAPIPPQQNNIQFGVPAVPANRFHILVGNNRRAHQRYNTTFKLLQYPLFCKNAEKYFCVVRVQNKTIYLDKVNRKYISLFHTARQFGITAFSKIIQTLTQNFQADTDFYIIEQRYPNIHLETTVPPLMRGYYVTIETLLKLMLPLKLDSFMDFITKLFERLVEIAPGLDNPIGQIQLNVQQVHPEINPEQYIILDVIQNGDPRNKRVQMRISEDNLGQHFFVSNRSPNIVDLIHRLYLVCHIEEENQTLFYIYENPRFVQDNINFLINQQIAEQAPQAAQAVQL